MKKPFYEKLEDVPQNDKDEANYSLCTEVGSPNFNKYVLIIDQSHPVMKKNTELLAEKSQRDAAQQTAIQAAVAPKETEITNLKTQLAQAQTQQTLPPGHVAIPADDAALLQNVKTLGKFEDIKAKVEEHGTLKEQTEAVTRKALFADVAKVHGFDPEAFAALAEQQKLHEKLEKREVPDPKKPAEKVTHYFVKDKDAAGAETSVVVGDFVSKSEFFKPFLPALQPQNSGGTRRKVPDMGVGNPPETKAAGQSYVNSRYKLPAQKKEEVQ